MIALNNYKYMTKVNRVEMRESYSKKIYTVIYAEFINKESGVETEETILLDEYGHPLEIPADVIKSMELVNIHAYYPEEQ